jgi:hypothetical protein
MTEEKEEKEKEKKNCHMLITSLLNEGAVIKMMNTDLIHTSCRSESSNYQLGCIRHRSSLTSIPVIGFFRV